MEIWIGVSVLPPPHLSTHIASDASGSWGCGVLCNNQRFQLQWPTSCQDKYISFRELIPIVLAVMVWGYEWCGSAIHCQCDSQAVVCMLASRYSCQTDLMHLLHRRFGSFYLKYSIMNPFSVDESILCYFVAFL